MARSPAVEQLRTFDVTNVNARLSAIKQRLDAVDAVADAAAKKVIGTATKDDVVTFTSQISQLTTVTASLSKSVTELQAFMAQLLALAPGLMVRTSTGFVTRLLESDGDITIDNANGVAGNPHFHLTTAASRPVASSDDWFEIPMEEEAWLMT